jgi:type III secretion protein S
MQAQELIELLQKSMLLLMMTAAPAVAAAALVGLVIAVVQAATQLQDQSISQAVKLGAVLIVLLVAGNWMASEIWRFADQLLTRLPTLVR